MTSPTAKELALSNKPDFPSPKEEWDAFYTMWENQIVGKGIKVYEQHCSAKLRACMVGDPFACFVPNPDDAEIKQMIEDNANEELKQYWQENKGKHLRDVDPERYEKCCEELTARDEAYEKAGVTVLRNKVGWYPESLINFNASWGGPKFLSAYGSCFTRMVGRTLLPVQTTAPCRAQPAAGRPALISLVLEDPEAQLMCFGDIEPNPAITGPGYLGLDAADWRQMPDKTILWEYGAPTKDAIPGVTKNGAQAPAGWPRGRDIAMRVLSELGYKQETQWFDSNHAYHGDCIMMNIVEGVVGLPDDGKNGLWSDLPDCIKDWEILPLPLEDIAQGVGNSSCMGDGRVFINENCKKTIDLLDKRGFEPVPIPFGTMWETFNSGLDCSDANIWREND